jgi:hypothetical protein
MFTDALSKMILANMLTEATIRRSNEIAGRIRSWGRRLLEASPAVTRDHIPGLCEELEVIRAQFHHLREGDFSAAERRRILVETEKQLENDIIGHGGRVAKLRQVYLQSRQLSLINPAQLDRVEDLLRTLLEMTIDSERDVRVFGNLLNDLILEFSDRSLAMQLAQERFPEDPTRAKLAVHYQGMAKIIGANPIKPDNIAKFQQGWGIPSFLLPPGRRRSDPTSGLRDLVVHDGEDISLSREGLLKLGFAAQDADLAAAYARIFRIELAVPLRPVFNGGGRVKSFEAEQDEPDGRTYKLAQGLIQDVVTGGKSRLVTLPAGDKFQLQILAADRFGDVYEGLLLAGVPRETFTSRAEMIQSVPWLSRKVESLRGWLGVVGGKRARGAILDRIPILDLLSLTEQDLVLRMRELVEAQDLVDALLFREPFETVGIDPMRVSLPDLRTLHNIFTAVQAIHSASAYRVESRWHEGQRRYWGWRDTDRLFGTAEGTHSSYDEGKEMRGNKLIAVVGRQLKMGFGRDGAQTAIVPILGESGEVAHIVLLHLEVNESLPLEARIHTLGGKYQRIVNHASEYVEWDDKYLLEVPMVDLLMLSDEEIADERIVPLVRTSTLRRESASP